MEDSQNIRDKIKTCQMKLLFTQTRWLHETYKEKKTFYTDYYLVDKKWLDDYKKKNGYDEIVEELENAKGYNDYSTVKKNLLEELDLNEIDLASIGTEYVIENSFSIETQNLKKYKLDLPKNVELVRSEFIHDCFGAPLEKDLHKRGVFLGEQTILIYATEGIEEPLYYCSLKQNEGDDYSFPVNIDYIMFFEDGPTRYNELTRIADFGLKYYSEINKIDINKEKEQKIKDKNGKKIGKFLKINNDIFNQKKSGINNNSNKSKNQIKTCQMKLLFTQTRELHERYKQKNLERFSNYYVLVDKNWLDDYKQNNDYDEIVEELESTEGYNDYLTVKKNLLEELDINENDLKTIGAGEENLINIERQNLKEYELNVPKNIELVRKDFIEDCFGLSLERDLDERLYIGYKTVIISAKGKKNSFYCCSLNEDERDDKNFSLKVDYILIFENEGIINDLIYNKNNKLKCFGGIIYYLLSLGIDINSEMEQVMIDKESGKEIGKFLKFKEQNYNYISNQENNSINNNSNNNKFNYNGFNNNSLKIKLLFF